MSFWDEDVDTHLVLRLVPVGHEPSQLVELVNGQHVVVGGGIERHAEIFRIEEFLFIHVVACHEYVISSDAFLSLGGIVKRDTVGKHERIVLRIISVQLVQIYEELSIGLPQGRW